MRKKSNFSKQQKIAKWNSLRNTSNVNMYNRIKLGYGN